MFIPLPVHDVISTFEEALAYSKAQLDGAQNPGARYIWDDRIYEFGSCLEAIAERIAASSGETEVRVRETSAWVSAKRMVANSRRPEETPIEKALLRVGGKAWRKDDMDPDSPLRIYFNGLAALLGWETECHGTGNIKNARYRGEGRSNGSARTAIAGLGLAKFWYEDGEFHARKLDKEDVAYVRERLADRMAEAGFRAEAEAVRMLSEVPG